MGLLRVPALCVPAAGDGQALCSGYSHLVSPAEHCCAQTFQLPLPHRVPRMKQEDVMGKGWEHRACASTEVESIWGSPKPDLPCHHRVGVLPSGEPGGPRCHA